MANQNTVFGFQNYPVPLSLYTGLTETALLAPSTSGYYPGLPSPSFPLSTSTYPVVLWAGVAPDIAGSEFDGHPFEVRLAGTAIGPSGTSTLTIKLYEATNAVLTSGVTSSTYAQLLTHGPSGTGINGLISSGGAITLSTSAETNFNVSVQLIWDSVSQTLNLANAPVSYAIGATTTPTVTHASTSSVGLSDLNFFPTFTWGTTIGTSLILKEFSINRV